MSSEQGNLYIFSNQCSLETIFEQVIQHLYYITIEYDFTSVLLASKQNVVILRLVYDW